jgi:ATP-dependent DNA ligase
LAAVETTGWRLWGRGAADYTARYPELAVLRRWPAGTLVDGELVALGPDERCDRALLRRRHGLTVSRPARRFLASDCPLPRLCYPHNLGHFLGLNW